jgi:hypothetical protein
VAGGSGVTTASLSSPSAGGSGIVPVKEAGTPDRLPIGASPAGSHPGQGAAGGGESGIKSSNEPTFPPVPLDNQTPGNGGGAEPAKRLAATTDNAVTTTTAPPRAGPAEGPTGRRPLPPLQVVKSPQVTLEYAVDKVGPSGVGKVELWLTRDDGQTWRRYAVDESAEGQPAAKNGKHQRAVELPPADGVYGLTLVVQSRAGLGKPPPKPGEVPQMRIELDSKAPEAQLFVPTPAPDRRDALVLTWTATDRNLAPNPITLEWAEQKDGEWHTIAARLANTGRHVWQLPPKLPDRVYLRLTVRDTAGNEGVAVSREPQLVDLSEPEGTILGIVNAPENPNH